MTVHEFLDKVRRQGDEIEALKRQRDLALSQWAGLKGQRYDIDRVTGMVSSDLSDKLIAIEEKAGRYTEKLLAKIAESLQMRELAFDMICTLDDPEIRAVLVDRYLSNRQWADIAAVRAGLDERQVYRLAKQGLDELSLRFPEICQ